MKRPTINITELGSKGGRFYLVATIPKDLRKFFNGKRQLKRSCGSLLQVSNRAEAIAVAEGAKGRALQDEILAKYYEIDPLVFSAEKLLESLFATYDDLGRIQPESKWHKSKVSQADCKILATPKNNQEEYDLLVNRLRAMMISFLDADINDSTPIIDEAFKPIKREIDRGRGLGSKPLKKNQTPVTDSIRDGVTEVMNFHQDQLEDKLREQGTPHWYEWSKVGWVEEQVRLMRNSDAMREKMSGGQMDDVEKMMYASANINQEHRDRFNKIQSAFKDFTDKESDKSLGRGRDVKGVKFSYCMNEYHKDQRRSQYSTTAIKTERGSQEYFVKIMGDRDIALIDKKLGMQYINHLEKDYQNKQQGRPLSNATLRKKVGAVRRVLKWAEEQPDYDYENTWNDLNFADRGKPEVPRRSWEDAWIRELFELDIDDGLKLQLRILICTGCRLEEACALQMGDIKTLENGLKVISTERKTLKVKIPKNRDSRAVRRKIPIINVLQKYIDKYLKTFTEEERKDASKFLFVDRYNYYNRARDGKYSNEASEVLLKAIAPVRNKYLNPDEFKLDSHSFRTTFSRITSDAQLNSETRQKIIGHMQEGRNKNYVWEPLSPDALMKAKKELDKINFNMIKGEE